MTSEIVTDEHGRRWVNGRLVYAPASNSSIEARTRMTDAPQQVREHYFTSSTWLLRRTKGPT